MQKSLKTIVLSLIALITCTSEILPARGGFGQRADANRTVPKKQSIFSLMNTDSESAKTTIKNNCSVLQQQDSLHQTPLIIAATKGDEDLVDLMLKQPNVRQFIDIKDKNGHTALCKIADLSSKEKNGKSKQYSNIITKLIQAGANPELCTQTEQKEIGAKKKQD